jgi:hypothetical protein
VEADSERQLGRAGLLVVEGTWFCRKASHFVGGAGSGTSVRSVRRGVSQPCGVRSGDKGCSVSSVWGQAALVAPWTVAFGG